MTATPTGRPEGPSLADQVSRLYDLIAGYHLTNLIEVGREVGVWERDHRRARDRLGGARGRPGHGPRLHRRPVPDRVRVRDPRARRRRLADGAAHGRHPGRSRLALLPRSGRDGPPDCSAARTTRTWPTGSDAVASSPTRTTATPSSARSPTACARCRGSSSTSCCRVSRRSGARLAAGARVLDLGMRGRLGDRGARASGSRPAASTAPTSSRGPSSWRAERIVRHGLTERCSARLLGPEGLTDDGRYDVITMFLVVHEILPELKDRVLAAAARALAPGGSLVIFDEAYPDTDAPCARCRAGSRRSRNGSS